MLDMKRSGRARAARWVGVLALVMVLSLAVSALGQTSGIQNSGVGSTPTAPANTLMVPAAPSAGAGKIDSGDTAWMLMSAALVMLMVPGLALFYGGMVRRKYVLATMLLNLGIRHAIGRAKHGTDRHRLHQLHVIVRVAMQVAALLGILLIVFGPPTQLSTIIGLLTAGFTVVMKDFIVAFFGWFTLMGKNGISVGDWVEIEGVSGAVIEIGLLKTVLLELGNWTEVGHPTGRRVAFSNSFAMEGHYFNFSTSSQWLWDELQFTLPAEGDPYETAHKIRELVERETRADAAEAGKDWQSVTHRYGTREFSAAPAVNLRPGANGLEVVVRYIARAPQRNVVKAKLFDAVVDVLRKGGTAAPAGSAVRGAGDQPA